MHKKICHLLFVLTVIVLTVFKWHDLQLPYFWDELGVYAQAADYQFHHHIGLMPSTVPPLLSRGHPLLFTFINAAVMRLLGEQILVAHAFCFFISMCLLLAVYIKVSRYFNPVTGILSVVFLASQPLFLAQSGLLLPEMSLSLFIFLALCFYFEESFFLFAFFGALAILTKEAAVVLPVAAIAYSIFRWIFLKSKPAGLKPLAIVLTLSPYFVFGLFLMVQKQQNGWYFFPLHMHSITFDFHAVLSQLHDFLLFIFWSQGRWFMSFVLITGGALAMFTGKWTLHRMGQSFVLLLVLLFFAFLAISAMVDLYVARYVLVLLVLYVILIAAALSTISSNRFFVAIVLMLVTYIGIQNLENGQFNYDADLGYRRSVHVMQQAFGYVAETAKPGEKAFSNFPGYFALTFQPGGYISGRNDLHLAGKDDTIYYEVLCSPGTEYHPDTSLYTRYLLRKYEDGFAHAEVYLVERNDPGKYGKYLEH